MKTTILTLTTITCLLLIIGCTQYDWTQTPENKPTLNITQDRCEKEHRGHEIPVSGLDYPLHWGCTPDEPKNEWEINAGGGYLWKDTGTPSITFNCSPNLKINIYNTIYTMKQVCDKLQPKKPAKQKTIPFNETFNAQITIKTDSENMTIYINNEKRITTKNGQNQILSFWLWKPKETQPEEDESQYYCRMRIRDANNKIFDQCTRAKGFANCTFRLNLTQTLLNVSANEIPCPQPKEPNPCDGKKNCYVLKKEPNPLSMNCKEGQAYNLENKQCEPIKRIFDWYNTNITYLTNAQYCTIETERIQTLTNDQVCQSKGYERLFVIDYQEEMCFTGSQDIRPDAVRKQLIQEACT